jgi:hypothetical protein
MLCGADQYPHCICGVALALQSVKYVQYVRVTSNI